MADPLPKPILPYLNGCAGQLRLERFWAKVDRRGPDECWPWMAACNQHGYGNFRIYSYRTVTSSRMALIAATGTEPFGMLVLHHCDNPPCCNPAHLYFGTASQNNLDKWARGRARLSDQSGQNNGAAKVSEDDIARIVQMFRGGRSNVAIAREFPITHSMVSKIRLGYMWRSVTERMGWEPQSQLGSKAA